MLTHGIPPAFDDATHYLFIPSTVIRDRVSPKFIGSRICVSMAFTEERLVVLKVVSVAGGAAFSGITMDQFLCAPLFSHPLL